jgi:hypothetical protein
MKIMSDNSTAYGGPWEVLVHELSGTMERVRKFYVPGPMDASEALSAIRNHLGVHLWDRVPRLTARRTPPRREAIGIKEITGEVTLEQIAQAGTVFSFSEAWRQVLRGQPMTRKSWTYGTYILGVGQAAAGSRGRVEHVSVVGVDGIPHSWKPSLQDLLSSDWIHAPKPLRYQISHLLQQAIVEGVDPDTDLVRETTIFRGEGARHRADQYFNAKKSTGLIALASSRPQRELRDYVISGEEKEVDSRGRALDDRKLYSGREDEKEEIYPSPASDLTGKPSAAQKAYETYYRTAGLGYKEWAALDAETRNLWIAVADQVREHWIG